MAYIKKINGYKIKDEEARTKINNILGVDFSGASVPDSDIVAVKKATNATTADQANKVQHPLQFLYRTGNYDTGELGSYDLNVQYNGSVANTIFGSGSKWGNIPTSIIAYAGHAIRAKQDEDGYNISETYATKEELAGRDKAHVFDYFSKADIPEGSYGTTLKESLANDTTGYYKLGNQLLIKDKNVPDYWISAINDTKSGDYGYYEITELEAAKVDLSEYDQAIENITNGTTPTRPKGVLKISVGNGTDANGNPIAGSKMVEFNGWDNTEINSVYYAQHALCDGLFRRIDSTYVEKAKQYVMEYNSATEELKITNSGSNSF